MKFRVKPVKNPYGDHQIDAILVCLPSSNDCATQKPALEMLIDNPEALLKQLQVIVEKRKQKS